MSTPTSGSSVGTALFEERLWPAPWIWLVAAGAAGAPVVTFAPINLTTRYRRRRRSRNSVGALEAADRRVSLPPDGWACDDRTSFPG